MGWITTETVTKQPDISYAPDFSKYELRTKLRLQSEDVKSKALPAGSPEQLESDLVWDGESLPAKYDWTYELTGEDVDELEGALKHFQSLGKPLGYIDQTSFPLRNLHSKLRSISKELHLGHGFKVVRGLPVTKHTREENIIIYAGLSSHIAPIRGRQDKSYNGQAADVVLNHIKDLSTTDLKGSIGAPAYTRDKQVFHTDSGDIVSLFALSTAAEGGTSRLAST